MFLGKTVTVFSKDRTEIHKMKLLVLALCVAVTSAAVARPWQQSVVAQRKVVADPVNAARKVPSTSSVSSDVDSPILRSDINVNADGFAYAYETGNGIAASASGSLKTVDKVDALTVQGSYHYVAPDGTPVQVDYTADENGYQPNSDLLPVPPPIPEAIVRSLAYIAAHPPKEY
ncbi:larval cuticle protein 4 [Amyelois transitella]|uniref:larval cuticle protein 4 n=1 Tax=Amyelois transitella TaxID=680683 RepID=UPI00298FB930|nr:larval cuticle protein 4 [Amyelois transitella]